MTAKEWNKSKNTFKKVYNNVRNAHPDWSNQRVYMAVKNKFSSKKDVKAEPTKTESVEEIVLHKGLMTNDTVTLDIYADDVDMGKIFTLNNVSYRQECPNRYVVGIENLSYIIMLSHALPAKIEVILTIHNGIGFGTDYDMMLVSNALWKNNIKYDVSYEDVFINVNDLNKAVDTIKKVGLYAELI